jgi:hypothetical protein
MLTQKQKRAIRLGRRARKDPEKTLLRDGKYLPQPLFDFCVNYCINRNWLFQYPDICNRMSDEQFEYAVQKYPWSALACEYTCSRLSDAQFSWCIADYPGTALVYEHSCNRLSDKQFEACLQKHSPHWDLQHVVRRVTDVQFNNLFEEKTWRLLRYEQAVARMSDVQFDECVRIFPPEPLKYSHTTGRLSDAQFDFCIKDAPWASISYNSPRDRLSISQWDELIKRFPEASASSGRRNILSYLTPYQKAWCLRQMQA